MWCDRRLRFPIANVPAIRRTVDDLVQLGIERIIVVVGHGEASVRAALRGCTQEIVYVRQPQASGTADAVLCAAHLLDEDFLVVAGDVVTAPENIRSLCEQFAAESPVAAALIQPLGNEDPRDWLIAQRRQWSIARRGRAWPRWFAPALWRLRVSAGRAQRPA